jgi:hypothetical protein
MVHGGHHDAGLYHTAAGGVNDVNDHDVTGRYSRLESPVRTHVSGQPDAQARAYNADGRRSVMGPLLSRRMIG